ncbi:hypothetical protein CRG98_034094 [Punica granatum]|uniref:Reverse transcriptase Ty1/copia-type domain-containing protein n=1 Tax=Punica granatum TaxID=22663 RepID=A0A2I0IP67_PUNGR|nr:hypothetical protein CRG98_034094 [Punica granatum]
MQELFVHGDNDHMDDPTTYEEAISDIDSFKWLEVMKFEMHSMSKNEVWDLVDPPESIVPIRNKWAFKRKIGANEKMNVKTAFLNGYIEEDIFINQPKGFESKDKSKKRIAHCETRYPKEMSPKTLEEKEKMAQVPYALAISSLMYAMLCTRPNIAYAVSVTRRCAVSWKSSKQETIAHSTTKAEYIAAFDATKEAVWIQKFVIEFSVIPSISSPVELYCDNTGAIAQAKEPRSHQKSKYIEKRYNISGEIIGRGDVAVQKVKSSFSGQYH